MGLVRLPKGMVADKVSLYNIRKGRERLEPGAASHPDPG